MSITTPIFFKSSSEQDTEKAGASIGKLLEEGDIVLLNGDLGAGKTCFVRGVLGFLQKGTSQVKSPSYTILNIYDGSPTVYHFDFYRLEDMRDMESLGLGDYWGKGISLVEWPGRLCDSVSGRKIDVIISIKSESEREIEVRRYESDF